MTEMYIHKNPQCLNENEDIITSIIHDHDYLHWNNNNHTIDDNITTVLASDLNFGIFHYENDTDEVSFEIWNF